MVVAVTLHLVCPGELGSGLAIQHFAGRVCLPIRRSALPSRRSQTIVFPGLRDTLHERRSFGESGRALDSVVTRCEMM